MAEEKHRMLYQGQDPCQMTSTASVGQQPPLATSLNETVVAVTAVNEPPPYDDAIMMRPSYTNYTFTDLSAERRQSVFHERSARLSGIRVDEEQQSEMQLVPLAQSSPEHPDHPELQVAMAAQNVSLPYLLFGRFALPQVRNFFALAPQPKLGDIAIPIICPACGQNGFTRLERSPNTRTHTWALWLCSFGWCCCACLCPYFMNCCRTTSHYCSNCQIYLGAYYPNSCFHR